MKTKSKNHCFSQHFLTSNHLLQRLVGCSSIGKEDTVYEIGTGKGHLTSVLATTARRVISVEIDPALYEKAKKRLSKHENIELICGDFLKMELPQNYDYKVFANIPYHSTTDTLRKLTSCARVPSEICLIVEEGAAKRMAGSPAENPLSVSLKTHWTLTVPYFLRRNDFHPAPSVDSVLIRFQRRNHPLVSLEEVGELQDFIKRVRRSGLFGKQSPLSSKQIHRAFREDHLPPVGRHADLTVAHWMTLFACYQKFGDRRNG